MCVCVCVHAYVRACVRMCVRACVFFVCVHVDTRVLNKVALYRRVSGLASDVASVQRWVSSTSTQTSSTATTTTATTTTTIYKPPAGIQLGVATSALAGWTKFYDKPYKHATSSSDLQVPSSAEYVFVGARSPDGTITLGAFGTRAAVLRATPLNTPHLHNGMYWYSTTGKSFGFAPTATIDQGSADTHYREDARRLSWFLDQSGWGGWRAGATLGLGSNTQWRKLVYWR